MQTFKLKDYNTDDTISAIATFPSKSALGVIKISGKRAIDIISKIFLPKNKKNIKKAKTYTLHYGYIIDRKSNDIVDEVLVSIMRAPRSYTREEVVEISSHGGTIVLNKILELTLDRGARLALPGEFTYRALANGRIDILQAESILNIVGARSEEGLVLAANQLRGGISGRIKEIKEEVKEVFLETEALINFPEEGIRVNYSKIRTRLESLEKKVDAFLVGSQEARILCEGLRCVICGKTNAGKSTLFNCLLKEERVIVSKLPGTTRDVVEEVINIRGIPLRIFDTAGILEPKDLIEKKAIEKTSKVFEEADLVILVLDGSSRLDKDDLFLLEKVNARQSGEAILAINKTDLKQKLKLKDIARFRGYRVKLSALKSIGIKTLEEAVFRSVYKEGVKREDIIFLNQYQRQILEKLRDNICQAVEFLDKGHPIDFANFSLNECLNNLGKLSGEVFCKEILESIFSSFCIGK